MIPKEVKESIDRYVEYGVKPGGFVRAVLENNLTEAFCRASDKSIENLRDIVAYCYYEIPANCWGSFERIDNWMAAKFAERVMQGTVTREETEFGYEGEKEKPCQP